MHCMHSSLETKQHSVSNSVLQLVIWRKHAVLESPLSRRVNVDINAVASVVCCNDNAVLTAHTMMFGSGLMVVVAPQRNLFCCLMFV